MTLQSMLASFWFPSAEDLFRFSPELALVGTLVALLIVPLVAGRSAATAGRITIVGIFVALYCTYRVAGGVRDGGVSGLAPPAAGGMLILDSVTVYFKFLLLSFLAGVTILWFIGSAGREKNGTEFMILLVGSALGMLLMTASTNLLMIIIAIELASLPSYAIVGFDKRSRVAAEASLKYVIFGGISAAVMLYGISLVYGMYQTLDMTEVAERMVAHLAAGHNVVTIGVALACLLAGIAFKIAAVPFHFWCPDAFEGARIEVTAWLSVSSKAAALVLLLRLVASFNAGLGINHQPVDVTAGLAWGIGIMAAVTCTVGNFAAYRQNNIKRLLAYSSIAHAGYMMMAAAVFVHPDTPANHSPLAAVLVYLLIYAIMNLGAFGVAAMTAWHARSEDISAFSGLGRRAPWLAVPMVCCLVSLVGLPPFGGFIGKLWLLMALGERGGLLYWSLLMVAVFNTLISLFYYLRIAKAMFFSDDGKPGFSPHPIGLAVVNACAIALVLLGVVFIQQPKQAAERYVNAMYAEQSTTAAVPSDADADIRLAEHDSAH